MVSAFQFVSVALVFSKGAPWRKPIYTNILFSISVLGVLGVCLYIVINQDPWTTDILEHALIPMSFRYIILLTVGINFLVYLLVEKVFVELLSSFWF